MLKIILDTNFVTIPFQFKVDIYSEFDRIINSKYHLFFPKICEKELLRLKNGKAAHDLMLKKGVKLIDIAPARKVDDAILNHAESGSFAIATQDKELKKKALKKSLAVITLRQKKFLIKSGGGLE